MKPTQYCKAMIFQLKNLQKKNYFPINKISWSYLVTLSYSTYILRNLSPIIAAKDGEALYSQQKQDRELTVAQIMNCLLQNSDSKKVGKTTRPFRYNVNQNSYDNTEEVTNRIKEWDLIDRVPEELRMEVPNLVQKTVVKTIPKIKKCKKAKWLSEEAEKCKAKEKKKDIPFECTVPKNSKER